MLEASSQEVRDAARQIGVVFGDGRALAELQQMKTRQTSLEIETNNNEAAAQLLQSFTIKSLNGKLVLPFESKEQVAVINKMLVQNNFEVYALHPQQSDLEQLFLDITSSNS